MVTWQDGYPLFFQNTPQLAHSENLKPSNFPLKHPCWVGKNVRPRPKWPKKVESWGSQKGCGGNASCVRKPWKTPNGNRSQRDVFKSLFVQNLCWLNLHFDSWIVKPHLWIVKPHIKYIYILYSWTNG